MREAARDKSGGVIDSVTDEEILAAYSRLAREEGVFCEPASAASVAGLIKAAARTAASKAPAASASSPATASRTRTPPGPSRRSRPKSAPTSPRSSAPSVSELASFFSKHGAGATPRLGSLGSGSAVSSRFLVIPEEFPRVGRVVLRRQRRTEGCSRSRRSRPSETFSVPTTSASPISRCSTRPRTRLSATRPWRESRKVTTSTARRRPSRSPSVWADSPRPRPALHPQ